MEPDIRFRDVPHTTPLEDLVREHMAKLDRFCDHVTSCRVAIERPQRAGTGYRVRLDVTVPPRHELVVERTPPEHDELAPVEALVIDAFKVMRKQLRELAARQRRKTKPHGPTNVRVAEATRMRAAAAPAPDGRRRGGR